MPTSASASRRSGHADVGIRAPMPKRHSSGGFTKPTFTGLISNQLQQRPDFQGFSLAFGGQFEGGAGHHG